MMSFGKFNILERDISGFLEIAIEDLFIWVLII